MATDYCQLWLTCKDSEEAGRIADHLFKKRLVACAKQVDIASSFRWKSNLEHQTEVLLVMDSRQDYFGKVEAEVAKLHSYETFVLQAVPVNRLSTKAKEWLDSELKDGNS